MTRSHPVDNLKERISRNWIAAACFVACLGLVVVAVVLVYRCNPCTPEMRLALLAGYSTLILLFFFGLMVLLEMASGRIDLAELLSEKGPDGTTCAASLSRFQLLIFTFAIALSLFLIVVSKRDFPNVPPAVLTLLGISASTYAVSKGIQASSASPAERDGEPPATGEVTSVTQDPATGRTTTTVHHPATGHTKTIVHDPATGQITTTVHNPTTVTTTTTVSPPPPQPTP
jgi:hypothetical protein